MGISLYGAFENHVIFGIARHRVQKFGDVYYSKKTQIIRQCLKSLLYGKSKLHLQFFREFIH